MSRFIFVLLGLIVLTGAFPCWCGLPLNLNVNKGQSFCVSYLMIRELDGEDEKTIFLYTRLDVVDARDGAAILDWILLFEDDFRAMDKEKCPYSNALKMRILVDTQNKEEAFRFLDIGPIADQADLELSDAPLSEEHMAAVRTMMDAGIREDMLLEKFGILFLPQMLGIELDEPIAVTQEDMAGIFPNDVMAQMDLSVFPGVLDRERDFATFRVTGKLDPHAIEAALAEAWEPLVEIDPDLGELLKAVEYEIAWTLDYAVNTRTGMPQNMVHRRHVDVHVDGEVHTVEESVRMRVLDCSQKANTSFCAASLMEKMERFSQSAELNQQILDLFRNDDFAKAKALARDGCVL